MKDTEIIFPEQILIQIPIFYRNMTCLETENVGELKVKARFSKSHVHFSNSYLNYPLHKPISYLEFEVIEYAG